MHCPLLLTGRKETQKVQQTQSYTVMGYQRRFKSGSTGLTSTVACRSLSSYTPTPQGQKGEEPWNKCTHWGPGDMEFGESIVKSYSNVAYWLGNRGFGACLNFFVIVVSFLFFFKACFVQFQFTGFVVYSTWDWASGALLWATSSSFFNFYFETGCLLSHCILQAEFKFAVVLP